MANEICSSWFLYSVWSLQLLVVVAVEVGHKELQTLQLNTFSSFSLLEKSRLFHLPGCTFFFSLVQSISCKPTPVKDTGGSLLFCFFSLFFPLEVRFDFQFFLLVILFTLAKHHRWKLIEFSVNLKIYNVWGILNDTPSDVHKVPFTWQWTTIINRIE